MTHTRAIAALALGALLLPSGQARAGAWTLGGGKVQGGVTGAVWYTDRTFADELDADRDTDDGKKIQPGDVIPFDQTVGGELISTGLTVDLKVGVLDFLDVGVAMPMMWTDFNTAPVDTVEGSLGLGDLRLNGRVLALLMHPIAVGADVELKLPTGTFDPSVFSVPLTEGQIDGSAAAAFGLSFGDLGWANARAGARLRLANDDNGFDPGEEFFGDVEVGAKLPLGFMTKVAVDGLFGLQGSVESFGASTPLPSRKLVSVWGSVLWAPLPELLFHADARWLVWGTDFPTGFQFMGGVLYTFAIFGDRPPRGIIDQGIDQGRELFDP